MNTQVNGRKRKSLEKPLCKYGLQCYQKNPEHRKKFKHPPKEKNNESVVQNALNDATLVKTPTKSVTDVQEDDDIHIISEDDEVDSNPITTEETVADILKSMPKDFFDFWEFCKIINKLNPQDAFSDYGYQLVGIYDLLSKNLPKDEKVDISCHWRYFYDPPEFQTVIKKKGKDLFHIGYFRDEPSKMPSILASNSAAIGGKLTLMGDNIFCAMNVELTKIKKSHETSVIKRLQDKLLDFASKKKYSMDVQTSKTKQRQKKVVAKTFHGLGIVVPVKNDVGYRPLPDSNATMKTVLKRIVDAKDESERLEKEEALDEIISNVNFANDECDYGMGLEFGLDLFCYGHPHFHNTISLFLPLAYNLLKRPKYGLIVKEHLKNRKKGDDLSTLEV